MRLVVDSNIFISSLDPKDIFHSECYPIFEKILSLEIEALCPALVLVETACVLRRRTGSEDVARNVPLLTKDKEMQNKAPAGILVLEPKDVRV